MSGRADLQDRIRKLLGPIVYERLRRFAYDLAETEADLYVFIARKAVCMLDVFEQLGLPVPEGQFISDRAVEMMTCEELSGKRVVIVDDIVIAGSTMHRVRKFIEDAGATVESRAFAVNTRWLVRELNQPSGDELALSDREGALFCSGLVSAIMALGRPYAVDFPMLWFDTDNCDMAAGAWELSGCVASDVTNRFCMIHDQRRIVLHVDRSVMIKILDTLGWGALAKRTMISKLRLYVNLATNRLALVPMVTFECIPECELISALHAVLQRRLVGNEGQWLIDRLTRNPIQGHRFLTYVASYALAEAALAALQREAHCPVTVSPLGLSSHIIERDATMCLGPIALRPLKLVLDTMSGQIDWPSLEQLQTAYAQLPTALSPPGKEVMQTIGKPLEDSVTDGYLLSAIGDLFVQMHREIEIPARRRLQEDPSHASSLDRLLSGLTYSDMLHHLDSDGWNTNNLDLRQQASQHLDYLVDRGVIVPVVAYSPDGNTTYRVYRPGEDLHFLDKHYFMLCSALRQSFDVRDVWCRDNIAEWSRVHIEKLCVILIKYMYYRQICTPVTDQVEGDNVRVDFHRMGAVVQRKELPEGNSEGLYDCLVAKGYLKGDQINDTALNQDFPDEPPVDHNEQRDLDTLALLWTRAVMGSGDGAKRRSIIMSSCCTPLDVARATFTDVKLCFKDFGALPLEVPSQRMDYSSNLKALKEWGDRFRGNQKVAIDNFHLKLTAWEDGRFKEFVEHGERFLRDANDLVGLRSWEAAWKTMAPSDPTQESKAENLIKTTKIIGLPLWRVFQMMDGGMSFACGGTWAFSLDAHLSDEVVEEIRSVVEDDLGQEDVYTPLVSAVKSLREVPRGNDRALSGYEVAVCGKRMLECLSIAWKSKESVMYRNLSTVVRETYGQPLHPFMASCFLWYDVKDSRSRASSEVSAHTKSVKMFKAKMNAWLREQVGRHDGTFCVYHGDDQSTDDEKYVFLKDAKLLQHFVAGIMGIAESCPDVYLRVVGSGCREIDTDLHIQISNNPITARANGAFFNWFSGMVGFLKEHDKKKEVCHVPHSLYYLNLPWERSGSPETLPRLSSSVVTVSPRVGDDSRNHKFRFYRVEQGIGISFSRQPQS